MKIYHHSQFCDLDELIKNKKDKNISISVILPTLNVEKTISDIISTIKIQLMTKLPLVDELGIIDSGSNDDTCQIAKKLGVKVYKSNECLPQYGAYWGKGENLWKGLYLFQGDIIVYLDSDIKNFHPKFIYGLIGPLLLEEEAGLVKSFYKRPLLIEGTLLPNEGGRITEILVRPLINLFLPELSWIIQPLSGEYAGRRKLLEKIPFFTGYGVEIGVLLEIYYKYGTRAIVQVDMDERIHSNKPLAELRKTAFEILQVFSFYMKQKGIAEFRRNISPNLKILDHKKKYLFDSFKIDIHQRPPMYSIKEYREKFYNLNEYNLSHL
jgi:glucosyl-3-phosphoglycerate synthase